MVILDRDEFQVSYAKTIPEPWKEVLKQEVSKALHVMPRWLTRLNVSIGKEEDSLAAQIQPDFKYRQASLTIQPAFFDLDADDRHQTMVHEFVHCLVAPLHQWACDILEETKTDDEHNAWLAYMKSGLEGTTEDVATALIYTATLNYVKGREYKIEG